jgi:hypothetical protein
MVAAQRASDSIRSDIGLVAPEPTRGPADRESHRLRVYLCGPHFVKVHDLRQFGLVAEGVANVSQDLVVRDDNGEIYTVRYEAVNAMLLNEFLEEHRKVEEQAATIAQLKKTIDTMLARLDVHDSKIQGVSDQVQMAQARQVVLSQP